MVVDYSKWDALEVSDDSDIEVHPNVDKKSFIRAKQAQIHQERDRRRYQIKTLKYERIINDGLMFRIDRLLTALKSHKGTDQSADALVFQSLIESAGDPSDDMPPPPPEGVHEHIKDKPTYSKMMAALVDQVKKEVDESKAENRLDKFIEEIGSHRSRVEGLQKELLAKLAELEKEEKRHITSDDIHTGFDYSNVNKKATSDSKPSTSSQQSSSVELLNPPKRESLQRTDTGQSAGADADIEEGTALDDDAVEASPLGKEFAEIRTGDYHASLQFIHQHPQILSEKESDGLMIEAFNSELEGKSKHAKQCVHQALLLQYCRQLGGKDGVGLFFKRITTPEHQAHKMFHDDVLSTYRRIHVRASEISKERSENPQGQEVEQIQLHAVDPNTTITIVVPPATPTATEPAERAEQAKNRQIFETFSPGLQKALETGSLDEVNKVLAKMSVDEAEEVVGKLGEGGMLSLEEGLIDATTEEGKKAMEEIEKTHRMPGRPEELPQMEGMVDEAQLAGDPE
ncbi:Hsp90 co-chaperone Cdc37 [Delitschia confertaspora ATCC 74209]|uniref:Hsp90 chaperone protein kinase-targeting subunit n=1 Tax=Delitschia confertaspora ATCC 74209 TaxID=1513339 RepID=A0A9P4JGR5_9PLEO|nr:Hsp90 co-chaperone Cdc37 [Delitschia confertaspora ATCC 74209]